MILEEMRVKNLGRLVEFIDKKSNRGYWLPMKRYTRFAGYSLLQAWPSLIYDKVFTKAYLPFAIRNNVILFAGGVLAYRSYIRSKKCRAAKA